MSNAKWWKHYLRAERGIWPVVGGTASFITGFLLSAGYGVACVAAVLGVMAGRKLATHLRVQRALRWIEDQGGVDALLLERGDSLIVMIPIHRDYTELDKQYACKLGALIAAASNDDIAVVVSLEFRWKEIGFRIACRDAEALFDETADLLRTHCTSGTTVRREHIGDSSAKAWTRDLFDAEDDPQRVEPTPLPE